MTAIIILNWNGWENTTECLQSLYGAASDCFVIVMDNGSTDGSVDRIEAFLEGHDIEHRRATAGIPLTDRPKAGECIVVRSDENLGFARGNNEALRMLRGVMPESILLLNNDTVVEPDFLLRLNDYAASHPQTDVLCPMICYEARRDVVWNCGGRLSMGMRRYHFANQSVERVPRQEAMEASFVTGCALWVRPRVLLDDGGLFTERFFFGEEDFNFCMRMKRERRRMACVLTSRIYHKVSSSTANRPAVGKIYVHYLNRFIDIRLNTSAAFYAVWAVVNMTYATLLLARRPDVGLRRGWRVMSEVMSRARTKDGVSRSDFTEALSRSW